MVPASEAIRNIKVIATTAAAGVGATIERPPNDTAFTDRPAQTAQIEQTRLEIEKKLAAREKQRARWIADAESNQVIDAETGEVMHNMQHSALAKHDGNDLKALEFRAKLAGLLHENERGNVVNIAVCMTEPGCADPDAQVLDIGATRR